MAVASAIATIALHRGTPARGLSTAANRLWESSSPDVLATEAETGLATCAAALGQSLVRALGPATDLHVSTPAHVEPPDVVGISVQPETVRVAEGMATPVTVTSTRQA
jgi:hypothetical protein